VLSAIVAGFGDARDTQDWVKMRSKKYDPRRYYRSGTLNKEIIGGLLMIAATIFIAAFVISTVFR